MANFSDINDAVQQQLATQAPTDTNGSPAAPLAPVEPTVVNAEQDELTRLRQENEQLKSERTAEKADHEAALAKQRLQIAVAQANKPSVSVGTGAQDVAIEKAINAVGGNCRWHMLSAEQRAAALGISGAGTKLTTIKKFFGAGSNAAEAQRLHSQQPDEYKRLRALAKVNGIL